MSQPFDFSQIPLRGRCLIEASAGTGKTWSITALYLRLLLELDHSVQNILVLSFSNAATAELRIRLHQRLLEAQKFLQDPQAQAQDPLQHWLAKRQFPTEDQSKLGNALLNFDEAAIFTLHAFCQKQLTQHQLATATPADLELGLDINAAAQQSLQDFWRGPMQQMHVSNLHCVLQRWASPRQCLQSLKVLLNHEDSEVQYWPEDIDLFRPPEALLQQQHRVWAFWKAEQHDLKTFLLSSDSQLKRKKGAHIDELRVLIEQFLPRLSDDSLCAAIPEHFKTLGLNYLLAKNSLLKKARVLMPESPFWSAAQAFMEAHQQWQQSTCHAFLRQARDFVTQDLQRLRQSSPLRSFDDLIEQMQKALNGETGLQLAQQLAESFPVALVDEFQDTDTAQIDILQGIYKAKADEQHLLILIGDPKQAIYGFRGADIFSYFALRQTLSAAQIHSLDTNFRSSRNLIEACNALLLARPNFFGSQQYQQYVAVKAADEKNLKALINQQQTQAGVRLLLNGTQDYNGIEEARRWSVECCARDIRHRLNSPQFELGSPGQRIQAANIAILVRDRNDATRVQQALQAQGLQSVFRSHEQVFHSDAAVTLRKCLRAVLHPQDHQTMARALFSPWFGLDPAELLRQQQSRVYGERLALFYAARERWLNQGILAMMFPLLAEERVIPRLLQQAGGEREITNLLHLLELCHEQQQHCADAEALLLWLEQASMAQENREAAELRLESDSDLIQIVTFHSSKGLEFGLVYIPLLWDQKKLQSHWPTLYHDEQQQAVISLDESKNSPAQQWAVSEMEQEQARLFYVAITRAQAQLVLCYPCDKPLKQVFSRQSESLLCGLLWDENQQLRDFCSVPQWFEIETEANERNTESDLSSAQAGLEANECLKMSRRIVPSWQVSSFSALARLADQQDHEQPDYDAGTDSRNAGLISEPGSIRSGFTRGALAGECLHKILEQHDFTQGLDAEAVAQQLQRFGLNDDATAVSTWLNAVLQTPLAPHDFCLADLKRHRCLVEMEFHFPLQALKPQSLPQNLQALFSRNPGALHHLQGFMKGFIDLVFEHQGRFYLADYKSNFLGAASGAYASEFLHQAMLSHHYDLQAQIYLVALHRYLSQRLPGYSPEKHLGGSYYLFLRGMAPEQGEAYGVMYLPVVLKNLFELERFLCGGPI